MDGEKKTKACRERKTEKGGVLFFSFPFFFLGGCKRLRVQQCAASLFVVSSTELGWKGGNGSVLGSCYISQRGLFGRNAKQKSNRGNGGVRMA